MTTLPYTGSEYLDSLDDGREVWIYGERVTKIAEHPAFRNCARMLARLYDALHEDHASGRGVLSTATEWGGFTHRFFKAPTNAGEQLAARDAIAGFAQVTYGWLGRSPDYKASFLATLGANAEFYTPFQENARRWYRYAQERVAFVNHAIIHPPVDRHLAPGAAGSASDVCVHVTRETDGGIYVSGAKVVATGSALTHFTFVAHHATRLLLEHGWLVQRTSNGGFEKLVVWNAAPQEERQPRGELHVGDAIRRIRRRALRLTLEPEQEVRADEDAADRELES